MANFRFAASRKNDITDILIFEIESMIKIILRIY